MKKLLTVLAVLLTFGLASQAQTFVAVGVATSQGTTFESLEVGGTSGKNRLAVVVETYNQGNNFTFNSDREFYGGVKYTRVIKVSDHIDLLPSAAAKVHLESGYALVAEPGVGVGLNVSKSVSFIANVSSPVYEGSNFFRPVNLKAGLGLQINL